MTLEEAIKHCEEKMQGCDACANGCRQLAEWLKELQWRRNEMNDLTETMQDRVSVWLEAYNGGEPWED